LNLPGRKKNALGVVAIDFGTTFSGYAYSLCEEYKKDQSKIYINKRRIIDKIVGLGLWCLMPLSTIFQL
jgi:hypothetical protein